MESNALNTVNEQGIKTEVDNCSFEKAIKILGGILKVLGLKDIENNIVLGGGVAIDLAFYNAFKGNMPANFSFRDHRDIDLLVSDKHRGLIKDALILAGVKFDSDSLMNTNEDHGFELTIEDKYKVVFYPFFEKEDGIKVLAPSVGVTNLDMLEFELPGLKSSDIIEETNLPNDLGRIKTISPEMLYVTKSGQLASRVLDSPVPITDKMKFDLSLLQKMSEVNGLNSDKITQIEASITDGVSKTQPDNVVGMSNNSGGIQLAKIGPAGRSSAAEISTNQSQSSFQIKTGNGYVDALILAFITGVIGGVFLEILLQAIK